MVSHMRLSCSTATTHARSNPSAIRMGWIPRSRRASLCSRRAPASTNGRVDDNVLLKEKMTLTNNSRCTIPDLIILTFGKLHKQFCDLVFDLHLPKNRGAVGFH